MTRPQRNIPLFALGILLVLFGFGMAMYSLPGLGAMTKDTTRVLVPSETVIDLIKSGEYTIFHETVAVIDGQRYESDAALSGDMVVTLVSADGSHGIDVRSTPPLSTYSRGAERRGVSAFRFQIEEPGRYQLNVDYATGDETPRAVLSIASWSPFSGRLALQGVGSLMLIGIGVVIVYRSNGALAKPNGRYSTNFAYEHRVPYTGSAEEAFGIAEKTLLPLGYKLEYQGSDTLDAVGPGMRSTKQPALLGATLLQFVAGGKEIHLRATLGGVRSMRNFLVSLIAGLGLFFLLLVAAISLSDAFPSRLTFMVLLPLVPWVVIGPIMIRAVRTRTTNAIDTLMENMVNGDHLNR